MSLVAQVHLILFIIWFDSLRIGINRKINDKCVKSCLFLMPFVKHLILQCFSVTCLITCNLDEHSIWEEVASTKFAPQNFKSFNPSVQHNKQYRMKALLKSLHLNGNT